MVCSEFICLLITLNIQPHRFVMYVVCESRQSIIIIGCCLQFFLCNHDVSLSVFIFFIHCAKRAFVSILLSTVIFFFYYNGNRVTILDGRRIEVYSR